VLHPDILADQDQVVGEAELQDLEELGKRHARVSLGDRGAALGDFVAFIFLADPDGVCSTVQERLHHCNSIRDALFSRTPREETAGVQFATFHTILGVPAYLACGARCSPQSTVFVLDFLSK
jgi:hypothetical protein